MKAISEKVWRNAPNAMGQYVDSAEQIFEIEQSDVGVVSRNYRGCGHSTYTFKLSDVGRTIAMYTDKSSWNCWVFYSQKEVSA